MLSLHVFICEMEVTIVLVSRYLWESNETVHTRHTSKCGRSGTSLPALHWSRQPRDFAQIPEEGTSALLRHNVRKAHRWDKCLHRIYFGKYSLLVFVLLGYKVIFRYYIPIWHTWLFENVLHWFECECQHHLLPSLYLTPSSPASYPCASPPAPQPVSVQVTCALFVSCHFSFLDIYQDSHAHFRSFFFFF